MSQQRKKVYNAYVYSDIFHKEGRSSPERRLLDKKIKVNVKPKDCLEFRQDVTPGELKTGKRYMNKKGSDIFFIKKKINDHMLATSRSSNHGLSLVNEAVKREIQMKPQLTYRNTKQSQNDFSNQTQTAYRDMSIALQTAENNPAVNKIEIKLKPKSQWKTQCSTENQKFDGLSTSRDNKIKMLRSNIFFDQENEKCPINIQKEAGRSEFYRCNSLENSYSENNRSSSTQNNRWIDKLDWKTINTEVHFKEKGKTPRCISAFERRLKENQSEYFPETTKRSSFASSSDCWNDYLNQNNCIDEKQKIKNMYSFYTNNASKIGKQCENYSSMQGITFFEKNASNRTKCTDSDSSRIDTFQIGNINPFQEKEVQRTFYKKGIPLFDVDRKKSNNSGKHMFEFKIRHNINDKAYKDKIDQIKADIKSMNEKAKIVLLKNYEEIKKENTRGVPKKQCRRSGSALQIK